MARKKQTKQPKDIVLSTKNIDKSIKEVKHNIDSKVLVTLSMAGIEYKSIGIDVHDALQRLPLTYMDVKTKGTITVVSGNKKCERLFYLRPLKALIANKLRKIGYAKQMEALLK